MPRDAQPRVLDRVDTYLSYEDFILYGNKSSGGTSFRGISTINAYYYCQEQILLICSLVILLIAAEVFQVLFWEPKNSIAAEA